MNETAIDALVALGIPMALRTGLCGIDDVLQNDLQYGDVSEIIGDSNVGKTQLCYALVANMLLEMEFSVVWIDSNGSFRSHRLMDYISGRKGTSDKDNVVLLDRLLVVRATDHIQLMEALEYFEVSDNDLEERMDVDNIRFIIIDNIHEMFDERMLNENSGRSAIMNIILSQINALTDIGFTIVTTSSYCQEDEKTEFAKVWREQMKGRILIEKDDDDDVRTVHSLNVENISSRRSRFRITRSGLQDEN